MPLLRLSLKSPCLASVLILSAAGGASAQIQMPSVLTPPPLAPTTPAPDAPAPVPRAPVDAPPPPAVAAPPPAVAAPPVVAAPPRPPAPPTVQTAPAPVAVQAAPLQAPDLFSADAGKPSGLPTDLWRGASLELARAVLPMASSRPLSPAAAAFARRVMSTGAQAPDGGGSDADLAAARINAVLSLGDPMGAGAMLEHTPGVRQNAALSQVAAETYLVLGREDEACALNDNLVAGKDGPYFRRLRAYCLLRAGDKPGAQLAYDLAAEQAKDDVYKRLMAAALTGAPGGPASLRNGIDYALSKRLNLDLAPALDKAWAPILTMVAQDGSAPAPLQAAASAKVAQRTAEMSRAESLNPAVRDAAQSLEAARLTPDVAEHLASEGVAGARDAQQALALYAAAGAQASGQVRAAFAGFDLGASRANQARLLELDAVSVGGSRGDAALLVLWLMADAGEAGPALVDRARIVRAMNHAGFSEDSRAYALEGVLALRPAAAPRAAPPPPRTPPAQPAPRKKR